VTPYLPGGDDFGQYELLEKLGAGGMGEVYRARDRRIGRTIAIKVIHRDKLPAEQARVRFEREARIIGSLNHPNIATLYDVSLGTAHPYLAMEFLPGGTLGMRMRQGPMAIGPLLRYATHLSAGLAHAHSHGIVHRDLKPANVLFSADDVAKIIDFGLARERDSNDLTLPGAVMGTAEYMSPEQALGQHADQRSDIYSLGVILYHAATGKNPFACENAAATLHRIVYDQAPPLAAARPDLPAPLARLIASMLEKEPAARPQDLNSVVAELRALEASSDGTPTETIGPQRTAPSAEPPVRRRPALWWVAALVLLAAAAWFAYGRYKAAKLPAIRQVAVLPFQDLSHDPQELAFSDGLVELLTSALTQLEPTHQDLWVIPSADVRRLSLHSVAEARKAFPPVNLVVTGSLQSDGTQTVVIVNLSRADTMDQIGSERVPVDRADRSGLLAALTSALLRLLDLEASNSAQARLNRSQPKAPSAYDAYLQAKGYLQHGEIPDNLNRAIDLLEKSVAQDSKSALSQALLGDAYLRRYRVNKEDVWLAKADQLARRALELDPDQSAVHLTLGRLYRTTGQPQQAIEEIQRAIALDTTNVAAYTQLALVYESVRRPEEAEQTYLVATRTRPSYFPAYSNLGVFYWSRGEYAKALKPLKTVVELAPDYADGHTTLATLYYFMERYDEALAEYDKSLALAESAAAYSNRGAIRFLKSDYAQALQDSRRAVELDPKNPVNWGNLGDAQAQVPSAAAGAVESYRRAIELSREVLEKNPTDADTLGRLAVYLTKTSGCAEAGEVIRKALQQKPDAVVLQFKAAKVAEGCGNRKSALNYLESAMRKGYPRKEIEHDPDLSLLRQSGGYQALAQQSPTGK
jgi:eukaryotic-like serine/threonine-protein kinase